MDCSFFVEQYFIHWLLLFDVQISASGCSIYLRQGKVELRGVRGHRGGLKITTKTQMTLDFKRMGDLANGHEIVSANVIEKIPPNIKENTICLHTNA